MRQIAIYSILALSLSVHAAAQGISKERLVKDLDEVGRIASVMLDGDVCKRIVTDRAANAMIHPDPRDQWADADNYDVNHDAFIRTKKELIRLSRLVSYPCDVNLWMPFAPKPGKVHAVIRNVNEMSQFWRFGAMLQDMPPAMKMVLETGKRVTVADRPGWVSVLAPIQDSLGDVVGIAEVVSRQQVDAHENVK